MTKRPSIIEALDIRSTETVTVVVDAESTFQYPPEWVVVNGGQNFNVDGATVIIVDRVDLLRREIVGILQRGPRIFAVAVADIEHEKRLRRNLRTLYPWSEVWELATDFGKVLCTTTFGRPYDRSDILDMSARAVEIA